MIAGKGHQNQRSSRMRKEVEGFNWVDLIEMMRRDRVEENAVSGNQNESTDAEERENDT